MEEAERLCDRVAIMDHGRVLALGTPAELIATLGADHVVEFTVEGTLEIATIESLPGVSQARREADAFALIVREPHIAIPALLAELGRQGLALRHLATHHATLDDVFVNLTGRTLRDE
jgi:ABC-2 type transport system ATP-binding protein